MKRKYRIKKLARNEFSALSGIDAFNLDGGTNCLIVRHSTIGISKIPTPKYAYYLYREDSNYNKYVKVNTTCGVQNCVNKDHLVPEYKPSKADLEYIQTYLKVDGIEVMAHNLKVPVELLTSFLDKK